MNNNNTRTLTVIYIIIIALLSFGCQVPAGLHGDNVGTSNSYHYDGRFITLGKSNKQDIQEIFDKPLARYESASDAETGKPSDSWLYLSMGEEKGTNGLFHFVKFDERGLLQAFIISETTIPLESDNLLSNDRIFSDTNTLATLGKTTKTELETRYGPPDIKAIGGSSVPTASIMEVWMYLAKIGDKGGGFIVFLIDSTGKVSNQSSIVMDDIGNIDSIFGTKRP